jgi:ABC-2 type transport system permease protein
MVVTIPREFEASLGRTGTAPLELTLNAEKGSAAGIVQAYASSIVASYAAERDARERPGAATRRGIEIRARNWYNPTLNYKHFMVPGILVALVTLIGTLLTAQNIAREKELGTLEQLNVTPITRSQFIAAKLLPFWVLGLVELTAGLLVAWLVFDVPMRGSLLLLFAAAGIYLVAALAIGLWISTLVETQQQAMFVTFFIMNVYLLMSGLFTPVDSMAQWVQVVSELNPVRHFVSIARAVLVKGAGLHEIARPLATLVVFGAVVLSLAVRQYSKRTA